MVITIVSLLNVGTVQSRPHAGFSGLAASADSAFTAATNPAGITRFTEPAYRLEIFGFFSESTWEEQLAGRNREVESSSDVVVPSGYLIRPISDKYSFSFTLLGAGFSDDLGDWPGKYFVESYDTINLSAFPSLAYRVDQKLSVAASLALTYVSFDQARKVANVFDPGFGDGRSTIETNGFDVGFGLSMLYQLDEGTRWGLSYNSEMDPSQDGKVRYQGLGPNTEAILEASGRRNTEVEVHSRMPQSLVMGLYHEFANSHAVTMDLAWSDFSRFKLSEFYFNGEATVENEANYDDIYALSVGYSWPVASRWMLSAAGLYVDDMIEDNERTMMLRMDSMWSLGIAAEWQWTNDRALHFGVSYMQTGDSPVTTPEIPSIGSLSGNYTKRDTLIVRLGMTFGAR